MTRTAACAFDALESRCHLTSVSFTIDRKLSELAITASAHADHVGTLHLKPQADGLDTAPLTGTLVANVTSKGVALDGGSTIDAVADTGSYAPGSKPADFAVGGKVKKLGISLATIKAAIRDLSIDLTGSSRRSVDAKGRFGIHGGEVDVTAGTLDYKLDSRFGDASGSKTLDSLKADLSDGKGTITGSVGSRVITVPITVVYKRKLDNGASANFTLKGKIVARETSTPATQALVVAPTVTSRDDVASKIFASDASIL